MPSAAIGMLRRIVGRDVVAHHVCIVESELRHKGSEDVARCLYRPKDSASVRYRARADVATLVRPASFHGKLRGECLRTSWFRNIVAHCIA
jgi:hypothetical protein